MDNTKPTPFKLDGRSFVEVMFGPGATVVDPFTVFAQSAGYESWHLAVEAMRAGKTIQGRAPQLGARSTFDFTMFNMEVAKAGLYAKYNPDSPSLVTIGLPSKFTD